MNTMNQCCYKQIILVLTLDCNLNCSYCFEKDVHRKEYMSDETIEDVIKQIHRDGHFLCDNIEFFGGEPMLCQRQMADIIEEFGDSLFYTVMTNGTIPPTDDFIQRTKRYADHISFFLSYDGNPVNYLRQTNLDAIRRTYRKLKKNGYDCVSYIATYTKEFSEHVVDSMLNMSNLGDDIRIKRLIHIAQYDPAYLKPIADSINKMVHTALYIEHQYGIRVNLPDNINFPYGREGFARRSYMCDTFTALCTAVGTDGKLYMCEPLASLKKGAYADSIKDWRTKPQYFTKLQYNKDYTICQTDLKTNLYYDKKTVEGQKLYERINQKILRLRGASAT